MKDELLKLNLLASSIRCNRDRRLFFFFFSSGIDGFIVFRPSWEPSTSFETPDVMFELWGRSTLLSRLASRSISSSYLSPSFPCLPTAVSPLFLPSLPAMLSGA